MPQHESADADPRPTGDQSNRSASRASKFPPLRGENQTNSASLSEEPASPHSDPADSADARSSTGDRDAHPRHASRSTALSESPAAADDEENSNPRRSTRAGEDFPAVVGWTSLGTALPGLGMINARNSRLGWVLLIGFVAGLLAVLAWVVVRGPVSAISRIVSSPNLLNIVAILLVVGALIWVFIIIRTYVLQKKGRRLQGWQRILGAILVASLVLCVGVPMLVGASYARVQSDAVAAVFGNSGGRIVDRDELWADMPRINVFLLGRDSGENREGTRPDTMLVASIDTRSGATTLISVPRNLSFPIFPEGSQLDSVFPEGFNAFGPEDSLINAVWSWAESAPDQVGDTGGLEPGMYATVQAVEGSLGLPIDYWASVDMTGFEDLINAIGGVDIDVERPIPMGGGTDLTTGMKNEIFGWIDPGPQTLSGYEALWYVRSREGSDNYDRMCRQQRMIKTTLDQIDPRDVAVAYPRLADSAEENIATNIPSSQVNAFIQLAVEMQSSEIKSAQINNEVVNTLNPDYGVLHQWVQDQIDPEVPSQAEEDAADGSGATPEPGGTEATDGTGATDAATDAATDTPTAPEEAEGEAVAEDSESGVESSDGKCYPQDYEPGDPWPGYPGNEAVTPGTGTGQ